MRLFCLNFRKDNWNPENIEAFLKLTPLLTWRQKSENHYLLWGDVTKTLHFFANADQSQHPLFTEIKKQCAALQITSYSLALGQTSWETELFSEHFDFFISEVGREQQTLRAFLIGALKDFAGLKAWDNEAEIQHIVAFFENLGLQYFSELFLISEMDWHTRFGRTGTLIWQKLQHQQFEILPALQPRELLKTYRYFDFPLETLGQMLWVITEELLLLFLRLEARLQMVQSLRIELRCEYSNEKKSFEWSPMYRGRDLSFYQKLIAERFANVSLLNPVRELEIEIGPTQTQVKQFDFFEPHESDQEKVSQLQSFLAERDVSSGFIKFENEIVPEKMLELSTEFSPTTFEHSCFETEETGRREMPVHAEQSVASIRPNLLLQEPHPLSMAELKQVQFLHRTPCEKMDVGLEKAISRNYWIVKDRNQNVLWIYEDLLTKNYFLQGFFD